METTQYEALSPTDTLAFLTSPLGRIMFEKATYETQDKAHADEVLRCTVDTIIKMGGEVFQFRHYMGGVAGVSIWDETGDLLRAYAFVDNYWLLL